eukprot:m.40653 g.40653  ORF g.40653 m.40653 type:complete len:411 (+) comp12766_c0_seq1:110-1342(+)
MDNLDALAQGIEAIAPAGQQPPPLPGASPAPVQPDDPSQYPVNHEGYHQPRGSSSKGVYDNVQRLQSDPDYASVELQAESPYATPSPTSRPLPATPDGRYHEPQDSYRVKSRATPGANYQKPKRQDSYIHPQAVAEQEPLYDIIDEREHTRNQAGQAPRPRLMTEAETNQAVLPKNHCALCRKPVTERLVQAMGLAFHEEHFQCIKCEQSLADVKFYAQGGMPFCSRCYADLHSPKCGGCHKPIADSCLKALDKDWHVDCFVCFDCKRPFGSTGFFPKGEAAVCQTCYQKDLDPCRSCGKPATGTIVHAIGGQYHQECFVCFTCRQPFANNEFFEHEGQAYCKLHFHQQRGTICHGCAEPIIGKYLNALGNKWHPEHFTCTLCMRALAGERFRERKAEPYCGECYVKLFG